MLLLSKLQCFDVMDCTLQGAEFIPVLLGTLVLGCSYVPLSVDSRLQAEQCQTDSPKRKGKNNRLRVVLSLHRASQDLPPQRLRFVAADAALSLVLACPEPLGIQAELCGSAKSQAQSQP